MLKNTFKKLGETFDTMREEMDAAFSSASTTGDLNIDGGTMMTKQGPYKIKIKDGNVEIDGPIKSLTLNGKLVRFKERP